MLPHQDPNSQEATIGSSAPFYASPNRLKLLRIGVGIRVSVQSVRPSFDEGFPEAVGHAGGRPEPAPGDATARERRVTDTLGLRVVSIRGRTASGATSHSSGTGPDGQSNRRSR